VTVVFHTKRHRALRSEANTRRWSQGPGAGSGAGVRSLNFPPGHRSGQGFLLSFPPPRAGPGRGDRPDSALLDPALLPNPRTALGLRGGEIARLDLRDIDWRAGTPTLKRAKSARQDVLPLPAATGEALVETLRHERPTSTIATVFVRRHAPHGRPIGVDAVRGDIGNALRSAGIPHGRSHSLRHTLACRLVNNGGSLGEVADVLRHRSLNTSLIYAKLDQQHQTEVALPWFGSAAGSRRWIGRRGCSST